MVLPLRFRRNSTCVGIVISKMGRKKKVPAVLDEETMELHNRRINELSAAHEAY
ncbi:hypothetical protein HNQ92_005641 [Rhabdobacter roseus]|uniref:Uncharacterized protein n=1 Tax=Rhabdobacter roseus TaxID=1655419 RepID=A0A840U153_9BACT|nr:hypothetical protein [Rhabdobacter roseus]